MKNTTIISLFIGLWIFSCGPKKTENSSTEDIQEITKEKIEALESDASDAERIKEEIEESARELEEAMKELDN